LQLKNKLLLIENLKKYYLNKFCVFYLPHILFLNISNYIN